MKDLFYMIETEYLNQLRKERELEKQEKRKLPKINYALKSKVLAEPFLFEEYKKIMKIFYKYSIVKDSSITLEEYTNAEERLHSLRDIYGDIYLKECEKIWRAQRVKISRLKKRITKLLEKDCLFLTLTFTNDVLNSTSDKTRKTYVRRFLKSFNSSYIANIDFGKINEREHYHSILQIDFIDYHTWTYGSINGQKVRNNKILDCNGNIDFESSLRLSKYIAKLTNHAIKETTKNCTIIYSRDFNSLC